MFTFLDLIARVRARAWVCVCARADEFDLQYPEPARSSLQGLSMFSVDLMSVAPPECVNKRSDFYTRLTLTTLAPMGIIAMFLSSTRMYNLCKHRCGSKGGNFEPLPYVFAFLEFVLSGVSTVICKTFVCEEIVGEGEVLVEQPTLSCARDPTREWWEAYASIMLLVYPIGVRTARARIGIFWRSHARPVSRARRSRSFSSSCSTFNVTRSSA